MASRRGRGPQSMLNEECCAAGASAPRLCCRLPLVGVFTGSGCTAGASSIQHDETEHRIHTCMLQVAAQRCWEGPTQGVPLQCWGIFGMLMT